MRAVLDIERQIGRRMRSRRRLLGLTLSEVADVVGLTLQMVQKYETGMVRMSVRNLLLFAEALEVEVDYLLQGLDVRASSEALIRAGAENAGRSKGDDEAS